MNANQVTPARRSDGGCGCGNRGGRWVRQGKQIVVLLEDEFDGYDVSTSLAGERREADELNTLAQPPSRACRIVVPEGKGMFVVSLPGTPRGVVSQARDTGLSWLAIECVSQRGGRHRSVNGTKKIKDYADALRSEVRSNFGIWVWGGHPQPNSIATFVSILVDTAVDVGAEGIIANPEDDTGRTWKAARYRPKAVTLMDILLDRGRENCLSVGVTTYGRPDFHRNMPWDELARADFGLPLIPRSRDLRSPRLCVEGWQARGFKVVVPVLQLKDTLRGIRYSAEDMKNEVKRTPMPNCAITWWSWGNAKSAGWKAVETAKMPSRCTSRLPSDYSCVRPRVGPPEFELEMASSCRYAPVASTPTPGRFYTIKRGVDAKGLLDLAARAYGVSAGQTRLRLAQRINDHPYNQRFVLSQLATSAFPRGRISFSPRFNPDIRAQAATQGAAPRGNAFATIYIPKHS